MIVMQELNGFRIVDDAPLSIRMSGHGMYAIEQQVCAANGVDVWWKQVYPQSGTCDINYERVLDKFNELIKMKDTDYAVSNLRTIKENVYAFASFAPNWPDGYLYDKVEAVENMIEELIKEIENAN